MAMPITIRRNGKLTVVAIQAMQIDINTGDFDASIRWNRK